MPGAPRVAADGRTAPMRARVGPACLALRRTECRLCGDACEAAAIRFVPRLGGISVPEVDAMRCNGCGDCLPACPTSALELT